VPPNTHAQLTASLRYAATDVERWAEWLATLFNNHINSRMTVGTLKRLITKAHLPTVSRRGSAY
jgi:hypothetical protein